MALSDRNKPKMKVAEYRLSLHLGVCLGPLRVRAVYYGEKAAWRGDVRDNAALLINNLDMFGGIQKEGGPQGLAYWLPGGDDQLLPPELASRLGGTPETVPGFRGVATMFFTGVNYSLSVSTGGGGYYMTPYQIISDKGLGGIGAKLGGSGSIVADLTGFSLSARIFGKKKKAGSRNAMFPGFVWGYNSPYLKPIWVQVTGEPNPSPLPPEYAMIGEPADSNALGPDDANPAYIIYDALTDENCMGAPSTQIDIPNFTEVGQALYDEGFGLSMGWWQQDTIENFISSVQDHIQATVFIHPRTGLYCIKLLRGDYDPDTLPHYDEFNSTLSDFQRRSLGETVNEIVVTYTNPENQEPITVTVQDTGNIIAQGQVVSAPRDYSGIRTPELAMRVAMRDLRTAAAPLASCTLVVDRDSYDLVPGDVIRVSNQKRNFSNIVFRVMEIDYGKTGDSKIRLTLLEDIFAYRIGNYYAPPGSEHEYGQTPRPMDYVYFTTLPAFMVANYGGALPADATVYAGVFATTDSSDTQAYEIYTLGASAGGTEDYNHIGTRGLQGRATLTNDLPAESTTLIESFSNIKPGLGAEFESFAIIGGPEDTQEIIYFSDIDSEFNWVVDRGMLDTTPKAWPAGTPIWFMSTETNIADITDRAPGELATYRLLSRTSLGTLPLDTAPDYEFTLSNRPHLPTRPAAVRVNGVGYSTADAPLDLVEHVEDDGEITVTWATRNRETEDSRLMKWDEASVTPPAGQTTTVRLYDPSNTLIAEYAGISGESLVLDPYDYAGRNLIRVNVTSELDGDESLQGHDIWVLVGLGGWGLNWGFAWGGGS